MTISATIVNNSKASDAETIIFRFHEMIRHGEIRLLPGGKLPAERKLAAQLGISLLALRNVLRLLVSMGILRSRPGSGTFLVNSSDPLSLDGTPLRLLASRYGVTDDEMFETKETIEKLIVDLAAQRATSEELNLMADQIIEMFASVDTPESFLLHNRMFQQTLARASKNRILMTLMNTVTNIFLEEGDTGFDGHVNLEGAAKLNLQIYRAIRKHDSQTESVKITPI